MIDEIVVHETYMRKALEEAIKGKGNVSPNPMVGCVIVKDNKIISTGYHKEYKKEHAEVNAINNAKECLEGSTLYVNLEPCSHFGNTPPCVNKIIEHKIAKVVIGSIDPNPSVSGNGIKRLRENNIEVITKILDKENKKLNEVFMRYIKNKEPFVIMKSAMSLDGKISTSIGDSKWISCEKSRQEVHELRGEVSGILVGVNTIIKDNPRLTCRIKNKKSPIRIIVDSTLRIPMESTVIKEAYLDKTIVVTTNKADDEKIRTLEDKKVYVLKVPEKNNKVNLKKMMKELGRLNIYSILLEGGSELNFSMLKDKLVNKVQFYIAPKIIGGENAKSSVSGEGFKYIKDCIDIDDMNFKKIDKDLFIEGYIKN